MVDVTPRDRWLSFIAKGSSKGIQVETSVPVYGDVCIDQDETNVALLPPKYSLLPRIVKNNSLMVSNDYHKLSQLTD